MEEPQEQLNNKKKEESDQKKKKMGAEEDTSLLDGFPSITHTTTRVFWNSRKRSANGQKIQKESEDGPKTPSNKKGQEQEDTMNVDNGQESLAVLSERRKALFEPLEPTMGMNGRNFSAEVLLPPPDFDVASYPKGWLIGKKRKLVNVDVVESMRRIAVQEMNRKDREIDGLNEQLEEDARALEHLQLQLLQERSKRTDVERENTLLQNQISMLMDMLNEGDDGADEGTGDS